MPTLKEKKRYLAVQVHSKATLQGFEELQARIQEALITLAGTREAGKAGVQLVDRRSDLANNRALLRVHRRYLEHLRASLLFIEQVGGQPASVRSLGASGMITKAYQEYVAG